MRRVLKLDYSRMSGRELRLLPAGAVLGPPEWEDETPAPPVVAVVAPAASTSRGTLAAAVGAGLTLGAAVTELARWLA